MQPEASQDGARFLVVQVEGGLHESRYVGLFHAFRQYPGVVSVTDLDAISRKTLDALMRKPTTTVKRKRRSRAA